MKEFEALNAVLATENWEQEMENRFISVKWSENKQFFLLKYNQLLSDFNDPVVRACRGIIYATDTYPFKCVCAPFIKFGNYGEGYCPKIDWSTARVLEKIDGSLMKVWNYNGKWYLSTNGTIDAYNAEVTEYLSFGELFEKTLKDMLGESFETFTSHLNSQYTYMFEMTSPESRIVIEYKERKLWFLSRRNMRTMQEDYENDSRVDRPKIFHMNKLEDCLKIATQMTKDQEGVVVNDGFFNRIKIKSPEYLMAAHLVNNRKTTTRRIIQMIKDLSIDDFLAYCSEYSEQVGAVQAAIIGIAQRFNNAWVEVADYAKGASVNDTDNYNRDSRKNFAKKVSEYKEAKDFLFRKYDYPDTSAEDYLLNLTTSALKRLVDRELK